MRSSTIFITFFLECVDRLLSSIIINFGIISPLGYRVKGKRNKNAEISSRSLALIDELMKKEIFNCEDNC